MLLTVTELLVPGLESRPQLQREGLQTGAELRPGWLRGRVDREGTLRTQAHTPCSLGSALTRTKERWGYGAQGHPCDAHQSFPATGPRGHGFPPRARPALAHRLPPA